MKKIVSNILYVLFFGFTLTLLIACILLIFNCSGNRGPTLNDIEAVQISDHETNESDYEPIDNEVYHYSAEDYQLIRIRSGYDALDTDEKRSLYDRIDHSVFRVTNDADENGRFRTSRIRIANHKMSESEIREVVNAYICDKPEIFWIENLFGYAYADDSTLVEFYSVLSSDDCERYIDTFNNKVDEILSHVGKDKTEYQRERIIHDLMISNCSYKTGVTSTGDGWQYFSAYGALVSGEAVCEGYSKSMQVLLTRVGIPCSTVRGEADGVSHMWNVVKLSGEWYHLDVTWDDADDKINYEYLNLTTEDITKNHTIADSIQTMRELLSQDEQNALAKYNFFVPMCTSKDMNYYYAEGVLVQGFDDNLSNRLIDKLVNTALSKEYYVPLRFGTEMTYNEYVNKLFHESPHEFYYAIEAANNRLDHAHKIDINSVRVLKNEAAGTLRVRIGYLSEKE